MDSSVATLVSTEVVVGGANSDGKYVIVAVIAIVTVMEIVTATAMVIAIAIAMITVTVSARVTVTATEAVTVRGGNFFFEVTCECGRLSYDGFMAALDFVCSRTLRLQLAPAPTELPPSTAEGGGGGLPRNRGEQDRGEANTREPQRQFRAYQDIEKGGEGVVRVLVPVLDLANHAPGGAEFVVDEDGYVVL